VLPAHSPCSGSWPCRVAASSESRTAATASGRLRNDHAERVLTLGADCGPIAGRSLRPGPTRSDPAVFPRACQPKRSTSRVAALPCNRSAAGVWSCKLAAVVTPEWMGPESLIVPGRVAMPCALSELSPFQKSARPGHASPTDGGRRGSSSHRGSGFGRCSRECLASEGPSPQGPGGNCQGRLRRGR
jgi:hypothetical protein